MNDKLKEPGFIIALLVILIAASFDTLAYLRTTKLDHDLVIQILTTFNTGGFIAAVQYAIGSSSQSRVKDDTIQKLVK